MDYSTIATFIAIAETKSLSKAAELLFLSQSTASYRLKSLEQIIGVKLVEREQGKGFITLTAKGEEFLNISKRWMRLYNDTEVWKNQKELYKLNIGCVDSLNTCVFYELYKRILRDNSKLSINVSSHWTVTIYKMIENYELDLGFVLWQLPYKNIVCEALFSERMVVVSSIDSNFPKVVSIDNLKANKEIFMYQGPNFQLWHDSLWKGISHNFSTVDTASLLKEFIDMPGFWSIVPISVAKKLDNGCVAISEIENQPPARVCYKIVNKNPIPNKVKSLERFDGFLREFLKSRFFEGIVE